MKNIKIIIDNEGNESKDITYYDLTECTDNYFISKLTTNVTPQELQNSALFVSSILPG